MSTPRRPAPRSSGAPMIAAFMRVVYSTAWPPRRAEHRCRSRASGILKDMAASNTLKKAAHAVGAHRITTHPCTRHIRVEHDGEVLAESDRAVALEETGLPTRYYLPRDDVRMELLEPSGTTSHCPFKGDAT